VGKLEIKTCKCYNPKAEIELIPNEFIQGQLASMNSYIKYLAELNPDFVEEYIQNLINRIKNAIDSIKKEEGYYDFPEITEKFEFLEKYPELRKLSREFFLIHMNPMKKNSTDSNKFIVFGLNQAKAFRRISYHRVKILTEMLGKEAGIELHTRILTKLIEDIKKKNPQKSDITMAKRMASSIEAWCKIGMADFTYCDLDEHMTIFRFDSCFTHEALKDFNDPDIAYYASCYGADIPAFNEGRIIQLRRTQTLHHYDFCDELYWDSRVHYNPKHPSMNFLKKMAVK